MKVMNQKSYQHFSDDWLTEQQWQQTAERFELTPRELEVLREICAAHDNVATAQSLEIGRDCVKAHLKSIYDKMGCSNRMEAILTLIDLYLHRPS